MQRTGGVKHEVTIYRGRLTHEELRRIIRTDTPWLIIQVTKAAGQGGGYYTDVYSFNEPMKSDQIKSLISDGSREDLLFFNCRSSWSHQSLYSQMIGQEILSGG